MANYAAIAFSLVPLQAFLLRLNRPPPLDRPDAFRDSEAALIIGKPIRWGGGVVKSQHVADDQGRFELPPDVSFRKQRLNDGWAYLFRHRTLGELGRILVQDTGDGHSRISCELVGDPSDPMTAKRAEVFKPLGLELAQRLEALTGTITESLAAPPPPSPSTARDIIESRLIPCDHCGTPVALLIFAPDATDPGLFEDYARKMYPEYTRLNVSTWVIGPALGGGPERDRPADILTVWPKRTPIERLRPAEFNTIIEGVATEHCAPADR
jgi:hypothetical protein